MSTEQNHKTDSSFSDLKIWIESICLDRPPQTIESAQQTASILANLGIDETGQLAGFAHCFHPFSNDEQSQLESEFSIELVALMQSVTRISMLSNELAAHTLISEPTSNQGDRNHSSGKNEENLRKMLITMVDDVRVVAIILTDQLLILRGMKDQPLQIQQYQAKLNRDIFAPLANRLGVWDLKWELEDYAFRYLNPKTYHTLAHALEEKRQARELYISDFCRDVHLLLDDKNISSEVHGRPKHIYSIWKKMQRKGLEFRQLWDIRAARIMVRSVEDCYSALSAIHSQWSHFQSEFSDYIGMPKPNGYRSIHTVISGPDNKPIEVQIRTYEMHEDSELGFAAHWRYKENIKQHSDIDRKVVWLRQLLDWKDEVLDSAKGKSIRDKPMNNPTEDAMEAVPRVYVFTPKGTIVDLPQGSTPIDFAYCIHSDVGHRTRGALVNDKMVSLNHILETGDQVNIQTVKTGGPSLDWLRADLGYVKTNRARSRIGQWHKHADYDQNISEGKVMLDRELSRLGLSELSYEKLNKHTHFQKIDDMLASIGAYDYKLSKLLYPFKQKPSNKIEDKIEESSSKQPTTPKSISSGFTVSGVGNLLTHMGKCCNPVPGDEILGFITMGRGVTIHRKNCNNIRNISADQLPRLIVVEWGAQAEKNYTLALEVIAYHRSGLLHDITEVLKSNKVDVLKVNMETNQEHITQLNLRLDMTGKMRPQAVIKQLNNIQNVFEIRRVGM